ncbi:MAG: primosomal protein N' [Firmicutes bacterium]|nr:primosomal protein N' [Bacillota bacterium]
MLLADVFVPVRDRQLDQAFTYGVPASLAQEVQPGCRVLVPFGSRRLTGMAWKVRAAEPQLDRGGPASGGGAGRLREILAVVDREPLLDAHLRQLVEWLAAYYLAPVAEAIRTVLPPGLERVYQPAYEPVPAGDKAQPMLGRKQRELLFFVQQFQAREGRPAPLAELKRQFGAQTAVLLRSLVDAGLLQEAGRWQAPRVQARTVEVYALALAAPRALEQIPPRAAAQRRVVEILAPVPEGLEAAELCRSAHASPATVRTLWQRGILTRHSRRLERVPLERRLGVSGSGALPGAARSQEPTGTAGLAAEEGAAAAENGSGGSLTLTPAQEEALAAIVSRLPATVPGRPRPTPSGPWVPFLLYGVTGSGKTEVYLRAIEAALQAGLGSILLVPEISLTPQMMEVITRRFGAQVAVLHSGLSGGERFDEWERVRRGLARVVVGTRSAVFSPVQQLGLIIIDEEQETSYKQEDNLRYRAHEVAAWRARQTGAALVLGSATPLVETMYRREVGRLVVCRLPERIHGRPLPRVHVVDMRRQPGGRRQSVDSGPPGPEAPGLFSPPLAAAIHAALARGEQVILFLNRRGYARVAFCPACGHVWQCPHCEVSLTYHARARELRCHYCDYAAPFPDGCPECHSPDIRVMGSGTEKVEDAARALFPEARILRMDLDTARRHEEHVRLWQAFRRGEANLLIGTQMVAKGFDFPGVTLVGVLNADTPLFLPDFRAAERTFELLTQVAGRAGRGDRPGEVYIQTYHPEHFSIVRAAAQDYEGFYAEELAIRRRLGYPPFRELILCRFTGADEQRAWDVARAFAGVLRGSPRLEVLGPAPAPLVRLRGLFRVQLVLAGSSLAVLRQATAGALRVTTDLARRLEVGVAVDVQPWHLL